MNIEHMHICGQKHPCVAEVFTEADKDAFGKSGGPIGDSRAHSSTCESVRVVRPSIHEIMAIDYDKILADDRVTAHNKQYANQQLTRLKGSSIDSWSGGSHDDMISRRKGWPEGVKRMQKAIEQVLPQFEFSQRPRPHWSEDGYELDFERFRDGHEKAYLSREMRRGSRNISISVQYGENCGTAANYLFLRGAAVVAAIDTLESMGYRIDLTAVSTNQSPWQCKNYKELLVMLIRVKESSEPVDLDYLANSICSPLMFRGNIFAWYIAAEWDVQSGLGSMVNTPDCFKADIHIKDLPHNPEDAKKLYDNIMALAHDRMSRKHLTNSQDTL